MQRAPTYLFEGKDGRAMRRTTLLGAVVLVGAVLWYLFRPERLVVDRTVNEAFPATAQSVSPMGESAMMESGSGMSESSAMMQSGTDSGSVMAESPAMAQPASAMQESPGMAPPGATVAAEEEPVQLARGRFHSNAHETSGIATIHRLEDGRRVLRLTQFATSNGPDVRVYLVTADDVQDEEAAKRAGFVDLGELKGNIGDQNYDVPADVDLSTHKAVTVWCRRFGVNFGTAPLTVPTNS
jgi:hypothetical protein